MSVIELPLGMALKARYGYNQPLYRGLLVRFMVEIGDYFFSFFQEMWRKKREDSKKGWHEDHSKVTKRDVFYKERFIFRKIIPRVRISFSILVRN